MALQQLIHNGVAIPEPPPYHGLEITVRGERVTLTHKQEEMALAWAKKHDTAYMEDRVFIQNFLADFSAELGVEPPLTLDEVDFRPAIAVIEAEKAAKERMTEEERTALRDERKKAREALRATFGFAVVNGEETEVANYVAEPSGIFMGRGQHPLRGRWKEGAKQRDVTLNLSPDAPRPPGDWKEIVWKPECIWVARWRDKLSGKLKYVWFSDSASVKQKREAEKFDQAIELHRNLDAVRDQIARDLEAPDEKKRMLATVCALIDHLNLRVGDEKEADEADTVGATTLRPEHVTLHADGKVEFKFLGKDSVELHRTVALPDLVRRNLEELMHNAHPPINNSLEDAEELHPTQNLPQLFPDIDSRNVNNYLGNLLPGLTAKVFRTHHATEAVRKELAASDVAADDPEYAKWSAAVDANTEAAILCNHTKKYTGDWEAREARFEERLEKARARVVHYREQIEERAQKLAELQVEAREKIEAANSPEQREKRETRYEKRIARAQQRLEKAHEMLERAHNRVGKIEAQRKAAEQKRELNLGTSLKSYIDPRVFYRWGQSVNYDVLEHYYPKKLRQKFAWVREETPEEEA